MRILIFVALEEELAVLKKSLALTQNAEQPLATGSCNGVQIDVICPMSMGRVPAAIETVRYLSRFERPGIILCVGLAGGFQEAKVATGSVICAQNIVDLASRKISDSSEGIAHTRFRRQDFECSKAVYQIVRSNEFNIDEWERYCRDNFDWPDGRVPSIREGRIASGDEVISSHDQRKKLVDSDDKILGVEMEAGGVCAAARMFNVPVSVLRVVSDMADPSKEDDNWRKVGMQTLSELIKRLPLDRVIEIANK